VGPFGLIQTPWRLVVAAKEMYNMSTAARNYSALIVGMATVLKENFSYWRQFLAAYSMENKSQLH
jgi:hypothetical protein